MENASMEKQTVVARREFEILGYPSNSDRSDIDEPFIRDKGGCLFDSAEHKIHIEGKTVVDYGKSDSYNEAIKAAETKSYLTSSKEFVYFYTCRYCNLLFVHPKKFLIHCKWHDFGMPFDFNSDLPKRWVKKKKESVKRKRLKRPEIEDVECDECHQVYKSRSKLTRHKRSVHYNEPKQCMVCEKTFKNNNSLRMHMLTHNDAEYACAYCPKKFKFVTRLHRHEAIHIEKTFKCDLCDKLFESDTVLKIHIRNHIELTKSKSFKCPSCPEAFWSNSSLASHKKIHIIEKPFECDICNQKYSSKTNLSRHFKLSHSTDAKDLPYSCDHCGRAFHNRSARERHIRMVHLKIKSYSCDECGKKYFRRTDVVIHKKVVHGTGDNKPYYDVSATATLSDLKKLVNHDSEVEKIDIDEINIKKEDSEEDEDENLSLISVKNS